MFRKHRLTHAVITSSVFLLGITAAVANPGIAHARSCNTTVMGDWSATCTVQQGDNNNAVVGIQVAATLESPPCSTNIDGDFGSSTLAEVECFQRHEGIQPNNGIVASDTWSALQAQLHWVGSPAGNNWSYWTTGQCTDPSCANFRKWLSGNPSTDVWYVADDGWKQMNTTQNRE